MFFFTDFYFAFIGLFTHFVAKVFTAVYLDSNFWYEAVK